MDYFLELRPGSLNLTSSILRLLNFFVCILFLEVIVTCQNCLSLMAKVLALEIISIFDGLGILFHSLFDIILVEARWVVDTH